MQTIDLRVYYCQRPDDGAIHEVAVSSGVFDFIIQWHDLGNKTGVRIAMFDDAWSAFRVLPRWFEWLAAKSDAEPSLFEVVAGLQRSTDGEVTLSGFWPRGCGVVGDTPPADVPPSHLGHYERMASWYARGCPVPEEITCADYIRAGLPGWDR